MTISVARSPSSGRLKLILPDHVERRNSGMDRSKKYKVGGGNRELPRHTWGLMCSLIFLLILGFVMTMSLSLPVKVRTTDPKTGKKVEKWIFRNSIRGCVGFPCPMDPEEMDKLEVVETLKGRVGHDKKKGQWHPGDVKSKDGRSSTVFYIDKFGNYRRKGDTSGRSSWGSKEASRKSTTVRNYSGAPSTSKNSWQKSQKPVTGRSSNLKRQFDHQDPPKRGVIRNAPQKMNRGLGRKFEAESMQVTDDPSKKSSTTPTGKQHATPGMVSLPDSDGNGIPDRYQNRRPRAPVPPKTVTLLDTNGNGIPDKYDKSNGPAGKPPTAPASETATSRPPPPRPSEKALELKTDQDKDGVPDYLEQGMNKDANKDGIPDRLQGPNAPTATQSFDKDADGVPDQYEVGPNKDDNGNGVPDRLETTRSAKGKKDEPEEAAAAPAAPGMVSLPDADGDGVPDRFEGGARGAAP